MRELLKGEEMRLNAWGGVRNQSICSNKQEADHMGVSAGGWANGQSVKLH